jgi:hypothetical protein
MIVPPAVFGHEFAGVISELGAGEFALSGKAKVDCQIGKSATAWSRPIPRRAAAVFIAAPARKIFAKICCFSTAPTPNPSPFPRGSSKKTCCASSRKPISATPRSPNRSPASCRASRTPIARRTKRAGHRRRADWFDVRRAGQKSRLPRHRRRPARAAAGSRATARRKPVVDIGDGSGLVARVREATKTHFDAVIEAVGQPAVWEAAVHLVRKGGAVNFFGGCPSGTTITLDTTLIHYSNLTLLASFHHTPRTIRRALEFIEAGVIRAADFVDGECPLTQLPELFNQWPRAITPSKRSSASTNKTAGAGRKEAPQGGTVKIGSGCRLVTVRLPQITASRNPPGPAAFLQVRQVDIHHVAGVEFGVGDVRAVGGVECMWSSA